MALFRTPETEQPINVDLFRAVVAYSARGGTDTYLDVARQLLQGDLFLDVTGTDPALSLGERVAERAAAAGLSALPAFLSPYAAVQTHPKKTALAAVDIERRPTNEILVLAAETGLLIDAGSKYGKAVIDADYIGRMLSFTNNRAVKTALVTAPGTDGNGSERKQRALEALAATIDDDLYFATQQAAGADGSIVVTNYRTTTPPSGGNYLLAFTSPLEAVARHPHDAFNAITVREVLRVVREDDSVAGVVLNAASPYLELSRADLAPLL